MRNRLLRVRFLVCLFVALTGAAPAFAAPDKPKLLVVDIAVSEPELQRSAATLVEQLLTEVASRKRFEVLGSSDVQLMLGMERQKQLVGCAEAASCLAELGGALGAPWIIGGALTRADSLYRFDLKLVDSREGRVTARVGRTLDSKEALVRAVASMVDELLLPIAPSASDAVSVGRVLPWVTLGLGAVSTGIGTGLVISAGGQAQALDQSKPTLYWDDVVQRGGAIQTQHWAGVVMIGAGAAVMAAGVLWAILGADSPPAVKVALGPGQLLVGGVW